MIRFFSCYPEAKEEGLCKQCYEITVHRVGVVIDRWGVRAARLCSNCEYVQIEDDDQDPFGQINDKLDKLLRWAGM